MLFFTLLYSLGNKATGQQYPNFNQAYFNPHLYNPATIGSQGYTELGVTYRKELLDVVNAPDVSVFSFQYSTNSSIDYGLMAMSDRSILLNKSTVMIGAAYKLFLSEASLVRFGLSIGYGSNVLDLSQQDQNDPVIAGASRQSSFAVGQFGFSFQQRDLEVGVSFPQIFRPRVLTADRFQPANFDNLKEFVARGSYRVSFGAGSAGLTPFAFYRHRQIFPDIVKGGFIGDYKKRVRLGLGYSTNNSWIGYLGLEILDRVILSYGYEFPANGNAINQNSNEFSLRYRLSLKKKDFSTKRIRRDKRQLSEEEAKPEEDTPSPVEPDAGKPDATLQNSDNTVDRQVEREPETTEGVKELLNEGLLIENPEIEKGLSEFPFLERGKFYVVVGTFEYKNNALSYTRGLNTDGLFVKVGRGLGKNLYYVYTLGTLVKKAAEKLKKELRIKGFGDAWIHVE